MILLRALARLITFLLLLLLGLAGLTVAIFSIQSGLTGLSLPQLADWSHLADLRDTVGHGLRDLETGAVNWVAALAGLGAVLLGVLLLAGILVPRRERTVSLRTDEAGTVNARRRALGQAAESLVGQVRGIADANVKAKSRRRGGGTLRVRAHRIRAADADQLETTVVDRLTTLTGPFALNARVDVRDAERGNRVA